MFSFFKRSLKSTPKTKPAIVMRHQCQQELLGETMQLPNGLVLSGSPDQEEKSRTINFELYDPVKKIQVATRRLTSYIKNCRFVPMSKEWILVECLDLLVDRRVYVVSSTTLESNEKLEAKLNSLKLNFFAGIFLGNQQFLTKARDSSNYSLIRAHDLSTMEFNQRIYADESIKDLSNGLFACTYDADNPSQYKVCLLKREHCGNPFQFKAVGYCLPKKAKSKDPKDLSYKHPPSPGRIIGLPDSRVLTYHQHANYFQIWQSDGEYIGQWSWHKDMACDNPTPDVQASKKGFRVNEVAPLPDGEHLVINSRDRWPLYRLFLFSLKTRTMKQVDFGRLGLQPWDITVLANGQVAVRMTRGHEETHLVCIDFDEMKAYRKGIKKLLDATTLTPDVQGLVKSYILGESHEVDEEEKPRKRWCGR